MTAIPTLKSITGNLSKKLQIKEKNCCFWTWVNFWNCNDALILQRGTIFLPLKKDLPPKKADEDMPGKAALFQDGFFGFQ